jgi:Flp pilus assembly pilin Flp
MTMFKFLQDRRAIEATEVGVLLAAVVLIAYSAFQFLGTQIADVVRNVAGNI